MKSRKKNKKKLKIRLLNRSFTLIELIIVIAIVIILSATIVISLFTSIKKGRDARRKIDLGQIKGALESFYEDHLHYPLLNNLSELLNSNGKKYIARLPTDPKTKLAYYYETNGTGSYYKVYALLENNQDTSRGVNPGGYVDTSCETTQTCNYGISSPNVTLAPTTLIPAPTNSPVPPSPTTSEPTLTSVPPTSTPTPTPTPNCGWCSFSCIDLDTLPNRGAECLAVEQIFCQTCQYVPGQGCVKSTIPSCIIPPIISGTTGVQF